MGAVNIEPATQADFEEFAQQSGRTPRIPPVRVIAFVGRAEGRIIAIGGIAYWPLGVKGAFIDVTEEARKHPVALHKCGLALIELARLRKMRQLHAVAGEPRGISDRWLLRLGFRSIEGVADHYVLNI